MKTPVSFLRFMAIAATTCTAAYAGPPGSPEDPEYPDNRQATSSAIGNSVLGVAYSSTRDVSGRMYRNRAGVRPGSTLVDQEVAVAPAYSAKGGISSAKDAKVASVSVPYPKKWEVFGSLFYYTEESDGNSYHQRSKKKDEKYTAASLAALVSNSTDTSTDVYGGAIGVEHHINRQWSIGFGLSAATGMWT